MIRVDNIADSRLDIFRLSEVELLRYNEPKLGFFVAETPKVIRRALAAGYEPIAFLVEEKIAEAEAKDILEDYKAVPVYVASLEAMQEIAGYNLTRGMLCVMRRNALPTLAEICTGKRRIAILEDVVNPTNVGAIFRSAAALHMDAVILTSGCSDPLYRRAARVSMGTVFQVPWTMLNKKMIWPEEGMKELKELGYESVAMALKENSLPIDAAELKGIKQMAILLGTEGEGLRDETLALCDHTVIIPMSHDVDSLNVAAASAVTFWELAKL